VKSIKLVSFIILLTFSDACVEQFDTPIDSGEPRLVVDGLITDGPGPYTVNLSMSSRIDQNLNKSEDVTDAEVKIVDDVGNIETLVETSDGTYKTTTLQGVVGRTYQLFITTADDKQYQSTTQTLEPAGEITNLYAVFRENSINENDLAAPQDAFWIYLDAKGDVGEDNFLRWRWKGVYHGKTYPELHVRIVGTSPFPDPLPCSGWVVDRGVLTQVDTCICCDCWVPHYNTDVFVSDNETVNENEFNGVLLGKVPIEKRMFYEKYYLEAEQLSASEEVHHFWKLVRAQQRGADDIFQPNVVRIKGNIQPVSSPKEQVYGIFAAAAIQRRSIFLDRMDVPKVIAPIDTTAGDCRKYFPGSTNIKPPYW
jgi:Domain of unknown function (DUF4249)